MTPRALLDVVARLAGVDADRPVAMAESTRRVLRDGLAGAARYGTASALGARGISALAKTGTAPMPGGSFLGIASRSSRPTKPTRGVVVVAPGAAGLDAASIAADLLAERETDAVAGTVPAVTRPVRRALQGQSPPSTRPVPCDGSHRRDVGAADRHA